MNKLILALKKMFIEMLMNEEMKKGIVISLNKKFNIPMVSEKTEGEVISGIVGATFEGIADYLKGDDNAKG